MEHRTRVLIAGVLSRRLLAPAALAVLGCNLFVGRGQMEARNEVVDRVAFIRPVTDGYAVASPGGDVTTHVPKGGREWVSSYTPDFSGFSFVSESSLAGRKGYLSLYVSLPGQGNVEVASAPTSTFDYQLEWTSRDGSSFLLKHDGSLWRFSRCENGLGRTLVASGVRSFACAFDRIYFNETAAVDQLYWTDVEGKGVKPRGSTTLEGRFSGFASGADPFRLIGYRNADHRPAVKEQFTVIDVASGTERSLECPIEGQIVDFVSIKGKTQLVVEIWIGGHERLDGTELTQFYLWDYGAGTAARLFKNHKFFQLHQLPENIQEIPVICDENE